MLSRLKPWTGRSPHRWLPRSCAAVQQASSSACSSAGAGQRRWLAGSEARRAEAEGAKAAGGEQELPWHVKWRGPLLAAAALPAVAGFSYWVLYSPALAAPAERIDIQLITEEVYDHHDNLFVFFLEDKESLEERKQDLDKTVRTLMAEKSLKRLKFYYNIKKEGDPAFPAGEEGESKGEKKPLRVVMYKGQRKGFVTLDEGEVPMQKILDFFALLSESMPASAEPTTVPRVCSATFDKDVVALSTPAAPVLVWLYEDTCFLCFLMRPLMNSLSQLFQRNKVPLHLRRLNIEKNDFPDKCPVARGTPTFVLFRGPDVPAEKWEEFKPKDLVEKMQKVFPAHISPLFEHMDDLQGMVAKRFQLFTQLIMWTIELQNLEKLAAQAPGASGERQDDAAFNSLVSEMMALDMRQSDDIAENVAYLQREVDEVEHDSMLMGSLLGEAVLRREKAEEELLRRKR